MEPGAITGVGLDYNSALGFHPLRPGYLGRRDKFLIMTILYFFLILLLYIAMIGLPCAIVLYIGTLWFQSTIYSEPAAGLAWRASVAALALAAYFSAFHFIAERDSPFNTLFSFTAVRHKQYAQFRSVRANHEPELFRLDPRDGKYRGVESGQPWTRAKEGIVREIIVEDDDGHGGKKDVHFAADLTSDDKLKKNPQTGSLEARYLEVGGKREMTDNNIGYVTTFRWWVLLGNLLLNFFHLGLWFACLWLILRYQWLHALFLAAAFWLPVTLFLLPFVRG